MSTDLVRNSRLIAVVVALAAGHLGCHRHTHAVVVTAPPPRPVVVAQTQTAVVVDEDGDGDGDVVIEDFNEPLANYGVWVYDPSYGRVWQPAADMSGPDFVPYGSDGDWVVNDDGDWVFQSRYHAQWGWATYHYGRWVLSDSYGWVWMPGRRWAPAWVEWRYGGGYVGWRPLAPRGVVVVEHNHWVFVDRVHIGHPGVMSYRVPREHWHVAYQSAAPIVEVRGHSHWRAGPSASELRGSGVTFTSTHVAAPAQGYVRAQGRVAIEAAAERRASGRVSATPHLRSGAAADAGYNAQVRPVDPMAPGARQVAPMPAPAPPPGPGARVDPMQFPASRPDPLPAPRPDPMPARPDPGAASRPANPIPTPRPDPGAASRPANPIPTPRPDPGAASRPANPIPTPRPDPGTASRPSSPAPVPAPTARPAKPSTPAPAPRPAKPSKPSGKKRR